jgi:hypothetical protein
MPGGVDAQGLRTHKKKIPLLWKDFALLPAPVCVSKRDLAVNAGWRTGSFQNLNRDLDEYHTEDTENTEGEMELAFPGFLLLSVKLRVLRVSLLALEPSPQMWD